jgi:phenylalanyl-tRNA synthetase alpha subunit
MCLTASRKVRAAFREILLEMGFSEMPTSSPGGFVESSFWNYDALFQPQQHPARDAHDTFFIKGTHAPQYILPSTSRPFVLISLFL